MSDSNKDSTNTLNNTPMSTHVEKNIKKPIKIPPKEHIKGINNINLSSKKNQINENINKNTKKVKPKKENTSNDTTEKINNSENSNKTTKNKTIKKSKDNKKSKDKKKKKNKKDKKDNVPHPEYDMDWRHIGKKSKFSEKRHLKYDVPARRKVREIFGEYIKDNPDEYGPDMIINHPKCKYQFLEVQVCTAWKDDNYPFSTVFLYSRKLRYGEDTLFLTLNDNMSRGFLFSNKGIDRNKPRRLKKWSRIFVYDVPWSYVQEIILAVFKKHVNFCLARLS